MTALQAIRDAPSPPEAVKLFDGADIAHPFPCEVPRPVWRDIGDAVAAREAEARHSIPGDQWITLRLDGANFSKMVSRLQATGVLPEPPSEHSHTFAQTMRHTLQALMLEFSAAFGYTQSDEMTIVIPPTRTVRGVQQPHCRNGRVVKLCTLAAGLASSRFVLHLGMADDGHTTPHFDCRAAAWESWDQLCDLLLWRARDCAINGVSDAVHRLKGVDGRKDAMVKGTLWKLKWLHRHGALPLPPHQRTGSGFVRRYIEREVVDRRTGQPVTVRRGVIVALPEGTSLLRMARDSTLTCPERRASVEVPDDVISKDARNPPAGGAAQ